MTHNDRRLPMIDLIRAFSFAAIIVFHVSYTLWGPAGIDYIPDRDILSIPLEDFARILSFSGFTILFLSFFLFGFKRDMTRSWFKLWLLVLIFFIFWAAVSGTFPYIWDIYPFLLVAIPLAAWFRTRPAWLTAVTGGIFVSIPFWHLEAHFNWPDWLTGPLFGNCSISDSIGEDWPLLPWIGYPIFSLGLGRLAREHEFKLRTIKRPEFLFWTLMLGLSTFRLGDYYSLPIGDRFACHFFRQPPLTFWAHQIWIIFLLRLSWLPAVDYWLKRQAIVIWITNRTLNQHFFLAYFVHYPYCLAWAAFAMFTQLKGSWAFALGIYSCLLWAEFAPKLLYKLHRVNSSSIGRHREL